MAQDVETPALLNHQLYDIPQTQPVQSIHLRLAARRGLMMALDIFANCGCVLLALWEWTIRSSQLLTPAFIFSHILWFFILPTLWFLLATINEYYNLQVAASLSLSIAKMTWITLQLLILYVLFFFVAPRDLLPRFFVIEYAVASCITVSIIRLCRLSLIRSTGFRRRLLIAGTGSSSESILTAVTEEADGDYEVVGNITSVNDNVTLPLQTEILGFGNEMYTVVRHYNITEVVIAYINEMPEDIFAGVIACYEKGIPVISMPDLYEQITGRIPIEHIGEHLWAQVLPPDGHSISMNLFLFGKRCIDILIALVGLSCFILIFPLLAVAIRLDSPGAIFFRQSRVGRGGMLFTLLKLRSMVAEAEKSSGPTWSTMNDPRVTRVGSFLRRTRLDELPQLLNVLRGEMSIVGPRPERPEFYAHLSQQIPFYRTRLIAKPGLTGWAQIRYRYGSSVDDALKKLQYDLYYIRHQTMALDFIIMARTIRTMLTFQGR